MERDQLKLVSYSGNMLMEIPCLNERDLKTVKMLLANDPYMLACFENALGNGLVFIVRTGAVVQEHRTMFRLVRNYYQSITGVNRFSTDGEDVEHTCMVSVDEYTYIKIDAASFPNYARSAMV